MILQNIQLNYVKKTYAIALRYICLKTISKLPKKAPPNTPKITAIFFDFLVGSNGSFGKSMADIKGVLFRRA
jgi:hypothetical protein